MTAYEMGRYEMFKRVVRFGQEYGQFFPAASDAQKTFALVASHVSEIDALARARQNAVEHVWFGHCSVAPRSVVRP